MMNLEIAGQNSLPKTVFVRSGKHAVPAWRKHCRQGTEGDAKAMNQRSMNQRAIYEKVINRGAARNAVRDVIGSVTAMIALTLLPVLSYAAAPDPVTVNVVMIDYKFQPDHLILQHGVHYRLHLENHGKETHEFTAPVFFAASKIDNPDVLNREHSEIIMQPGDTKDLFVTPGSPGTYDLRCADHDWDGMTGGITIQ
jgi:uncharacterized cupredoxin-like copper-binding protein